MLHFIVFQTQFGSIDRSNIETRSSVISEAVSNQDNCLDWSTRVKTYLMAENLWDFVEPSGEHSTPNDKSASKTRDGKNAKALRAIQMFCWSDTFSDIRENSSAKDAWDTLAKKCR